MKAILFTVFLLTMPAVALSQMYPSLPQPINPLNSFYNPYTVQQQQQFNQQLYEQREANRLLQEQNQIQQQMLLQQRLNSNHSYGGWR